MIEPRPATIIQRFTAAALNLVIGLLPLSLTNIIFTYGNPSWTKNEEILDSIAALLGLLQFVFVHKMQGSPGAVFVGLRVQYLDGTLPNLQTTLVRSAPYLIALSLIIFIPSKSEPSLRLGILNLLLYITIAFIVISSIAILFTGNRSIIDRITRTEIVKAYSVKVNPTSQP